MVSIYVSIIISMQCCYFFYTGKQKKEKIPKYKYSLGNKEENYSINTKNMQKSKQLMSYLSSNEFLQKSAASLLVILNCPPANIPPGKSAFSSLSM